MLFFVILRRNPILIKICSVFSFLISLVADPSFPLYLIVSCGKFLSFQGLFKISAYISFCINRWFDTFASNLQFLGVYFYATIHSFSLSRVILTNTHSFTRVRPAKLLCGRSVQNKALTFWICWPFSHHWTLINFGFRLLLVWVMASFVLWKLFSHGFFCSLSLSWLVTDIKLKLLCSNLLCCFYLLTLLYFSQNRQNAATENVCVQNR